LIESLIPLWRPVYIITWGKVSGDIIIIDADENQIVVPYILPYTI